MQDNYTAQKNKPILVCFFCKNALSAGHVAINGLQPDAPLYQYLAVSASLDTKTDGAGGYTISELMIGRRRSLLPNSLLKK
jgi:hypothetical protein